MYKVAFVRGAFLNKFEGQNFIFPKNINLHGFSSLHPIHSDLPFSVTRLPSISDLNTLPVISQSDLFQKGIKFLSNRTLGDSQILFGLEHHLRNFDLADTADPYYFYSYQLARMRQKNLLKKLVITYCETIPFNNESVARKKFIKYFTMSQADLFICHTELSKKALIEEGIEDKKIEMVKLGVDQQRFRRGVKKKSVDIIILFVGRLVAEKGILDLYEAFRNMKKSKSTRNVYLRIIGEGPLRQALERNIVHDGLQRWITIEKKNYDEMPNVYQEADIFCLPSKRMKTWEEQYGMVLIEAMASGLPVVSTKSGAIPEVVGDAGMLVTESRPNKLEEVVKRLIEDEDLRQKISMNSEERAIKLFDSRKTAVILDRIYTRVIG